MNTISNQFGLKRWSTEHDQSLLTWIIILARFVPLWSSREVNCSTSSVSGDAKNKSPRFISDILDCCRVSLSAQWGCFNAADSTGTRDTCINAHAGCWGCVYKPNKSHQLSASKAFVFNEICILLIHLECGCRRLEGWHQLNVFPPAGSLFSLSSVLFIFRKMLIASRTQNRPLHACHLVLLKSGRSQTSSGGSRWSGSPND